MESYIGRSAFALRTAIHDSTGKTPAKIFLGRKLILSFSSAHLSERLQTDIKDIISEVQHTLQWAHAEQAQHYNNRRRFFEVQVGQHIYRVRLLKKSYQSSLLDSKAISQYCKSTNLSKDRHHFTVSFNQIKPYYDQRDHHLLESQDPLPRTRQHDSRRSKGYSSSGM